MEEDSFEAGESGASGDYPCQASSLRKNGHVMIKGHPCKIVEMSTSKTGKHGHAKIHLVGIDIFTSKKYEDICPSTHNMQVPRVSRTDLQFLDLTDDGFLSLLDADGNTRDDIRLSDNCDLYKEIKDKAAREEDFMVTILSSMGEEQACATKSFTK